MSTITIGRTHYSSLRAAADGLAATMLPDASLASTESDVYGLVEYWEAEAARIGESAWQDDDGEEVPGLHEATIDALMRRIGVAS